MPDVILVFRKINIFGSNPAIRWWILPPWPPSNPQIFTDSQTLILLQFYSNYFHVSVLPPEKPLIPSVVDTPEELISLSAQVIIFLHSCIFCNCANPVSSSSANTTVLSIGSFRIVFFPTHFISKTIRNKENPWTDVVCSGHPHDAIVISCSGLFIGS